MQNPLLLHTPSSRRRGLHPYVGHGTYWPNDCRAPVAGNTRNETVSTWQPLPLLATYVHLLERAIYDAVHEHMLSLNLSYFIIDLKRLNANLGIQLEHTLLAFLNVEQRIGRHSKDRL